MSERPPFQETHTVPPTVRERVAAMVAATKTLVPAARRVALVDAVPEDYGEIPTAVETPPQPAARGSTQNQG